MEEGALLPGPPVSTLQERDIEPTQAALVENQAGERCVEKAAMPPSGRHHEDDRKRTVRRPLENRYNDICTKGAPLPWDESGGLLRSWPGGVRCIGGISVVQALLLNSGTSRVVVVVKTQRIGVSQGHRWSCWGEFEIWSQPA